MYKFKIKLLYNGKEFPCTKTDLLNFMLTLPLSKLDIISARIEPNDVILSGDIPDDIQCVTFLLSLPNVNKLSIGEKTMKF